MNFRIFYISALLLLAGTVAAAQRVEVRGRVISSLDNKPVSQANITSSEAERSVVSDDNGEFTITLRSPNTTLTVIHSNFVTQSLFLGYRNDIEIFLISNRTPMHSAYLQLPLRRIPSSEKIGSSIMIKKRDLNEAYDTPEEGLHGKLQGLLVISKSGMPGEGAYYNHRGIRTMHSSNLPLTIIDGVPYLTHTDESAVITGYSMSQFMSMHMNETEDITLVRGADAAMYGSLSSNGIINVTTEKSQDLRTRIEFHTVEGISYFNRRLSMLSGDVQNPETSQYARYIGEVARSYTSDLTGMITLYPFLSNPNPDNPDNMTNHYRYVFQNDTDWQDKIYTTAMTSENILKVKGGDAVANYAMFIGYLYNKGIIKNTDMNKFYTRMNADIKVTSNLSMFANAGFTYFNMNLMEQGMSSVTNPMLTAYHKSPLFSPRERDANGNDLGRYSRIAIEGSYAPTKDATGISNPMAIVNTLDANSNGFNVLVNVGLNYNITNSWKVTSIFGVNYVYNKEDLFVPGKNSLAIAPVSTGALNTVRSGVNESNNLYFNINTAYSKIFNLVHGLNATVGYQLLTTKTEYDYGTAINTSSDFYKTLQSSGDAIGRNIGGFTYAWNWTDFYGNATYDFKKMLYASVGLTADASSSIGRNANSFFLYPSFKVGFDLKSSLLRDTRAISQLMVRGEYAQLPNSRYLSSYSAYQYGSERYRDQTGIVRVNVPNTQLRAEVNHSWGVGIDFATFGRKFAFSVDGFSETTHGMLNPREIPSAYGFGYVYDNSGKINTYGIEVAAQALVVRNQNFEWRLGATFTTFKSKILDLGGVSERITTFSDGTTIINRVGEAPNQFYGYTTNGVISSEAEANSLRLLSFNGYQFRPGDIIFNNTNGNRTTINNVEYNIIDDDDRVLLGGATPDFYGGFNTSFKYRNIGLFAQFTYTYGNKIYNAVRRSNESMSDFSNQTTATIRRWTYDGQQTDMPKAVYGDPAGNSRFSDRWVEDGSFLRLKYITLSYTLHGGADKFFRQMDFYLTGENLFTATKYLGLDPELSYNMDPQMQGMDLAKAPLARSIRLGVKMNF